METSSARSVSSSIAGQSTAYKADSVDPLNKHQSRSEVCRRDRRIGVLCKVFCAILQLWSSEVEQEADCIL